MVQRPTPQDPTARAMRRLDAVLKDDALPEELVIVDDALRKSTETKKAATEVLITTAEESEESVPLPLREKARVLFISYGEDIFKEGSVLQKRYASYGALFEEVHVIVFSLKQYEFTGLQIQENVWAYPTQSTQWWKYPYDAYQVALQQLYFAKVFRVDVVYAEDSFELSFAAYCIAKRFRRPLVIEASEELYDSTFFDEDEENGYRGWWAKFVLPRAVRVVVSKARVREQVVAYHSSLEETRVTIVPHFVDVKVLAATTPSFTIKERYPKFTFTLLVVARLIQEEKIDFIINAAQHTLHQYPSIGLIIVGRGPLLTSLQALVRAKGLQNNVVFETLDRDYATYMKSAGMLLVLHESSESEDILMTAAAASLPVITTMTLTLGALFVQGESGIVCVPGDIGCVIKGITMYINDSMKRKLYGEEAKRRLLEQVNGSAQNNQEAFRLAIESAVLYL